MEIEIRSLSRHFGKVQAVNDLSITFTSGQVVAFVGPNGAGKTTTMRIMATLDEPTQGDVFIDGISVTQFPEDARRCIGFVPDTLPAYGSLSVLQYLDFFARAYGIRQPQRHSILEEIQDFTGLSQLQTKMVNALSKGMRQRLNLARALLHDPQLLILDEPAAGLDPRARVELRELLSILASQGKSIFISSHILSELTEICDHAAILECGRLVRFGSMDELLSPETDSGSIWILVRCLAPIAELKRSILESPGVLALKEKSGGIELLLDGSETEASELLSDLVQKGLSVMEFRLLERGLEQVFLDATRGEVQ